MSTGEQRTEKKGVANYWIKPGIQVVRKGEVAPVMLVERIDAVIRQLPGKERRHILRGVVCSWIDKNGRRRVETLRTNELEPAGDE